MKARIFAAALALSSLGATALALGGTPAGDLPRAAPAQAADGQAEATASILGLHGTNDGSGIDPKLPDHVKAELKRPPMSAYNSWKQLDQGSLGLVRGKAGVMKLPGGAALKLLLEGVEEKDGKRYAVSASITKDGKDFLPGAQFKARGGKTFFVGGIEHKGGVLFLGITIQ